MSPEAFYKQIDTLIDVLDAVLGQDTDTVWNRVIMPAASIIISDSQSLLQQSPHDEHIGTDQSIMSKKLTEAIPAYLHMFMTYRTEILDDISGEHLDKIMPVMMDVTFKLVDRALATYEETGLIPAIPPVNTKASSVDILGNLLAKDPLKMNRP